MANQNKVSDLVLKSFMAILENELVAAKVITTKKYDQELDAYNGLKVSERVPPLYVATETTNGVVDLSTGVQDTVVGNEEVNVNTTFGVSMGYADFERIKTFDDALESEALRSAASALAHKIDLRIHSVAATASFNWVGGTPGTDLSDLDHFASALTRLKEEGVEQTDLFGVITNTDYQKLAKFFVGNPGTTPSVSTPAITSMDRLPALAGVPVMETQQLPTLTVGTRAASGASLINGAAQNVNYRAVATVSGQGFHKTQTIAIDGLTAGHTIAAGEVFTIAGVNAYDNRAQQSMGRLQQFTVVTAATADGGGAIAALRIAPAMIVPGSGGGTDANVNTAHGTVVAAPADNAAITYIGTASTAYKLRYVLQRQAIVLSTAGLTRPFSDTFSYMALKSVPLRVRLWKYSDGNTGAHKIRFDTAAQVNIMDRRRIVRVHGA